MTEPFFYRLLAEHQRQHDIERAAEERRVDAEKATIEHRLEALNELRDEVLKDRSQFLQVATYDARHDQLQEEVNRLKFDLARVEKDLSRAQGRNAAFAVVLTIFLVLLSIVVPLVV